MNRRCTSSVIRRQDRASRRRSSSASSMAEIAGDTTAGFAAIICCAPYGVANLLVLAVYKVPAGLCRKAMRKRRRRRMLELGMQPARSESDGDMAELYAAHAVSQWSADEVVEVVEVEVITEEEFMELEKEMWDHFSAGGFWRSPSISSSTSRQQA